MNFLVAKNVGFLPFFFTIRPTKIFDLKENIAMKFPLQMLNPQLVGEKEVSDSEDGEKYWHQWEHLTTQLWKAIQRGVKLTLPKKWVLQWSNMYSNTSKSIGWMSQKSILWKPKNSLKKTTTTTTTTKKNRTHGFPNHREIIAIGQNSRKDFVPHDILYYRISCYSFNFIFSI